MNWKKNSCMLVSFLLLLACESNTRKDVPDVSKIPVKLNIRRFEQDLFRLDTNNLEVPLQVLETKYGEFAQIYFNVLLKSRDKTIAPAGHVAYVRGFLTHSAIRKLYDTCTTLYQPLPKTIVSDFEQAFKYYQYYFPNQKTPTLTTFISEYTVGDFIYGKNDLAIGLDFFLGSKYPYLRYNPDNDNFSAYLTRSFSKEHLVAKTLMPLIEDAVGNPQGDKLLDLMINNGKKLYLLDHLLPYAPDSVKLELPQKQNKWMASNELEIWAYFLQQNLLYSTEWQRIRKYVEYSPSSPGMPKEAPGRTANFIGWQIVNAYMNRYPQTSLPDLLALKDAQSFLKKSRYQPKRR
jgi:hypothetical protein